MTLQQFVKKKLSQFTATKGMPSIIFSSFVLGAAFGGYIPLQSLWLESIGRSFHEIGLTNGVVGLGIVISAHFVPRIALRFGITKSIVSGLIIATIMAILFRLTENLFLWVIIKFLSGLGLGVHWVLSEAWLIQISKKIARARAIAFYTTAMSMGFAVGPAIIWLFGHSSETPFICISLILATGALPFFWIQKYEPKLNFNISNSPIKLITKFPTIMAACIVAGGIDLAMLSLLPAIVMRMPNADPNLTLTLVPAMALGTIFFQYPIAKLADQYDPAKLCALVTAVGAAFSACLPFCLNSIYLANFVAFLGAGLIYGLYTIGLTMLSQRVRTSDLVTANAGFVIVFELSNLTGPTVAGWMVDVDLQFGFSIFVVFLASLFFSIFWIRHIRKKL